MRQEVEHVRFPKKHYFFKMRTQIIAERTQALQGIIACILNIIIEFMNALCNLSYECTLLLLSNVEFCDFIQLSDILKSMIITLYMN